jgi:hypothetical protein
VEVGGWRWEGRCHRGIPAPPAPLAAFPYLKHLKLDGGALAFMGNGWLRRWLCEGEGEGEPCKECVRFAERWSGRWL